MIGALAGPQPERRRRRSTDAPPRRDRPGARRLGGPGPQPPVGRSRDHLVVASRHGREVRGAPVQQPGVEATRDDVGVGEQKTQELDVGGQSEDRGVGQRDVQRSQRLRPVGGMGDHLGQHRVVVAADHHAVGEARVDPDAGPPGVADGQHRSPGGQESLRRVLGIHPGLDGVPDQSDVVLRERQLLPRCHPHLQLDQVEPGDHLGHGVLDLQAGVHLHEEELVGPVGGHDELDGARAGVVDAARGVARGRADPCPGRRVQQR